MGFDSRQLRLFAVLSAHNSSRDAVHEGLWAEVAARVRVIRDDPRYTPILLDGDGLDPEGEPVTAGSIDLGKTAYTAYGASTGWLNHRGEDMPSWGALPAPIAAAWQAAAQSILALHSSERDLMLADLGDLLRAVGMFDGAQDRSPHDLMQEAITRVRGMIAPQ